MGLYLFAMGRSSIYSRMLGSNNNLGMVVLLIINIYQAETYIHYTNMTRITGANGFLHLHSG